jgi:hypothetical protein
VSLFRVRGKVPDPPQSRSIVPEQCHAHPRTYLHAPLGLALQAKQSSLAVFLQPIVLSRSRSMTLTRNENLKWSSEAEVGSGSDEVDFRPPFPPASVPRRRRTAWSSGATSVMSSDRVQIDNILAQPV